MVIFNICSPMTRKNRGECFYIPIYRHVIWRQRGRFSLVPSLLLLSTSYQTHIAYVLFPYCFRFRKRER